MAPLTMHNNENATGTKITEPVNTITSSGAGGHQMVITPAMIQYHTEQTERVRGQGLAEPLMTIDASNRYGLAAASLVKYYGIRSTPSPQKTGRASWRRTWPSSTAEHIPGRGPECPTRSTRSRPWTTTP